MLRWISSQFRKGKSRAIGRISSELCPYCFDYFKMSETPFRCSTPSCPKSVDQILREKWSDATPKGKIIEVKGYIRECSCPDCKGKTKHRLCPNCHQELPHTIGEFRNLIVSVVGAKGAGKSCYLPVLIENLKQAIGPDLGFTLQPLNDDTSNRYNVNYRQRLMVQRRMVDVTRSGLGSSDSRLPLVFRLTFYDESRSGQRSIRNLVTLAFFDTAGEDMNSQDTMAFVNKYIYRSDGIILLLDPLQLSFVREELHSEPSIVLPDPDIETSDIITRLDNLIHSGQDLSAQKQISIPLAVTLSKFDAVEKLAGKQMNVTQNSNHLRGFDLADFQTVNGEVQALVDRWQGQYLLEQVKSGFSRHGFFAMTALGMSPNGDQVANIRPKRVADAFLWILYAHKLINAKR